MYPTERNLSLKFTACFLLGTFACLYLNLFVPPFTPICLGEDEGNWLLDAMRMLRGQVIYRDFFQFTAPGTQWVYFVLFVWLGPRTWVPNVLLILLGLGLVWLSVVISKRVMRGSAVFLPGFLFLTLAFRRAFAVTHHWWNELAVMGAIAVVIEGTTPARIAVAGLLCGLALWFNQTQGLLAVLGFGAFLFWESAVHRFSCYRDRGICPFFTGSRRETLLRLHGNIRCAILPGFHRGEPVEVLFGRHATSYSLAYLAEVRSVSFHPCPSTSRLHHFRHLLPARGADSAPRALGSNDVAGHPGLVSVHWHCTRCFLVQVLYRFLTWLHPPGLAAESVGTI